MAELTIDDRRRLDLGERRFWVDGAVVELQPKVFDLLALLASRPGSLVRRDEIVAALWPDVHVTDASLYQVLRRARRALAGADGTDPIETVPGAGYRLNARPARDATLAPTKGGAAPVALVGRDAELAALSTELRAGGAVALWGPAGVGKSTLARAIAAQVQAVSVRADGARDRRSLEEALARELGLADPSELPHRASAHPGEVWIVDPVEGPLDEVVAALRPRAPQLGWLAVGRLPLGPPLRSVALAPLPHGPGDWRTTPAGRLFRARLAAAGAETPAEAERLLAASGGLPLAIELLAARAARGSPSADPREDDPIAHFGRAVLAGLDEGDRLVFAALATFRRPATAASIEAVAGPELEPVAPRLERLTRAGLLTLARERWEVVAALRPLAEATCPDERRPVWRRRHAEVHARHGHPWLAVSYDVHGSEHLRQHVALELEDVDAALEAALDEGDGDTAAAAWLGAWLVWSLRGPADRAAERGRRVWARPLSPEVRSRMSPAFAGAVLRAGAVDEAVRAAAEGLELSRLLGDRHRAGLVGIALGMALKTASRFDEARRVYVAASHDLAAAADRRALGVVLTNLGALAHDRGDLDEALARSLEAVAVHRETGNRRLLGTTLRNLAQIAVKQGRWGDAHAACEEALAHHRVTADVREEAADHGVLAELHRGTGGLASAIDSSRAAVALLERVGDVRALGLERSALSDLLTAAGRHREARREREAALALHLAAGNTWAADIVRDELTRPDP